MADDQIEIRCPSCGKVWFEDVDKLEREEHLYKSVIYRGMSKPKRATYRVRCPQDGTYVVVEVEETNDG